MYNKFDIFLLYFIAKISIVFPSSLDPVNDPKSWTEDDLYKNLRNTLLNRNNPDYFKNIKYFIYDPEFYLSHMNLRKAYDTMYTLYDKYHISTHVFFISHMKGKYDIANFVNKLSYIIYKDNEMYNEKRTITVVFFIKDRKMRIRTPSELRGIISDNDALDILNNQKKALKGNNFQEVANGLIQDILSKYEENKDKQNTGMVLFCTILLIIGITIVIIYKKEKTFRNHEDKVTVFLDKLKNRKNQKEIFIESCIICLEDFKINDKNSENRELKEKKETSLLECGHKFHRKCIANWFRKQQKCPICRMEFNIKGNDDNNYYEYSQRNANNIYFVNMLSEILRVQSDIDMLNENGVNRIRSRYYPSNRHHSYYENYSSSYEDYSSYNDDNSGGASSEW